MTLVFHYSAEELKPTQKNNYETKVNLVIRMKHKKRFILRGELTPVKSPFFSYSSGVRPEAFACKGRCEVW